MIIEDYQWVLPHIKEADNYLFTNIIDRWISLFDSLINS